MRHLRTEHRSWDEPLPGADQGEEVYGITCENWLTTTTSSPVDTPMTLVLLEVRPRLPICVSRGRGYGPRPA